MQAKQMRFQRGQALKGADVIAILGIIKSAQGMPDQKCRDAFVLSIWMDWRRGDEDCAKVADGIGVFFDLYFSFNQDWERMYSLIVGSVEPQYRQMAEGEAQSMADKNIALAKELGPNCEVQVQGFGVPQGSFMSPEMGEA